jgi:hypothetical protein
MSIRTWLVGVGTATALGVSAQPGLAGTGGVVNHTLVFTATDHAPNNMRLSRTPGRIRLSDLVSTITAGPGCTVAAPHVLTCNAATIRSAAIKMGPGADRLIIRAGLRLGVVQVQGGPGSDRIRSEGPSIRAFGGPDGDLVVGGPRTDWLQGGPGDDRLRSHGGPDTIRGMGGDDLAVGGAGPDLILGGGADDNLYGRTGDDVLRGATGEDIAVDLYGTDRLYGGADPDYLNTKDGVTGDYENAGKGPDYGCAASPFPGDILVGCDENAGPCCIIDRGPVGEVAFAVVLRRQMEGAMS